MGCHHFNLREASSLCSDCEEVALPTVSYDTQQFLSFLSTMNASHYVIMFLLFNMCARSLAELRVHLTKPEKLGSDDGTLASRACLRLVISAIPSQEVEQLIEDIEEFDEELLKVNLESCLYWILLHSMNKK